MAIYHLTTKPVSRAGGRSATAASAYRSAELVHDYSTGETFDYTRKRGVEHSEIVLPTECAKRDINWARDREALWNVAEGAENRSNSRVAREYELALPHEMTREQRVELVRAFSQGLADRYGVAVDFAIHAPHREGDHRNHHAHLLTTTRSIEAEGLGPKTEVEWSETNRKRAGLVPGPDELTAVRAQWAQLTNERLAELGIEARIDHRTLEAQGIERVPTTHLGVAVWGMERRGIETEVGQRVREQQRLEAQARLERAAELGRVEREQTQVQRSILDLSGDLQAAKKERGLGLEPATSTADVTGEKTVAERVRALETPRPWQGAPSSAKRDRFKGLKLGAGRSTAEREAVAKVRIAAPEQALARSQARGLAQREASMELNRCVDRYARAWSDAWRMRAQDLPVLKHQKLALREAGSALDRARPGATRDLQSALQYEPATYRAMTALQGSERAARLVADVEHEERVRADPNLKAERLVKVWNGLEAQHRQLSGWEQRPAREQVEERIRSLVGELKRDPQLESILRQRQKELGIDDDSRLIKVVKTRSLKLALSLSVGKQLERGLGLSL
jgi:ATP-dependent exoDNAse (exonuclease V) alpha subunit